MAPSPRGVNVLRKDRLRLATRPPAARGTAFELFGPFLDVSDVKVFLAAMGTKRRPFAPVGQQFERADRDVQIVRGLRGGEKGTSPSGRFGARGIVVVLVAGHGDATRRFRPSI